MSETAEPINRLLAALPAKEYESLLPKLEEVPLTYTEVIFEPNDIIRHVYFPNSGIVSLLSGIEERSLLEVGGVGSEGLVGLSVFLGVKRSNTRALVQGSGSALRMRTADFLSECKNAVTLQTILQRYAHSLIAQISQSAVCSRFHPTEARLARWLLMTSDRMKSIEIQITQESLSNILGVRREAVTLSVRNLQQNKLIGHGRGNINILDRSGLEAAACRCYFIIKNEYKNIFESSEMEVSNQ